MSHTRWYEARGFEFIRTIGNSDWSGEVHLAWRKEGGPLQEIQLPGETIKAIFEVEGVSRLLTRVETIFSLSDEAFQESVKTIFAETQARLKR